MKYLDEYRDGRVAAGILTEICRVTTRPWTLMEVCGGQTHSIVKHGLDRLLPPEIELVHGPGCPVCVTPLEQIDKAHAIAGRPGVIFTSFGDMLRVPGTAADLLRVRAEGGDVRIVYSPLDAVRLARQNPGREVVFFAVGLASFAGAAAFSALSAVGFFAGAGFLAAGFLAAGLPSAVSSASIAASSSSRVYFVWRRFVPAGSLTRPVVGRQARIGRTGRGSKPPPQFGHTSWSMFWTHSAQNVHS